MKKITRFIVKIFIVITGLQIIVFSLAVYPSIITWLDRAYSEDWFNNLAISVLKISLLLTLLVWGAVITVKGFNLKTEHGEKNQVIETQQIK